MDDSERHQAWWAEWHKTRDDLIYEVTTRGLKVKVEDGLRRMAKAEEEAGCVNVGPSITDERQFQKLKAELQAACKQSERQKMVEKKNVPKDPGYRAEYVIGAIKQARQHLNRDEYGTLLSEVVQYIEKELEGLT